MAKLAMRKLTMMGAKHLLKGGHISKATHGKMVKSAKAMKMPPLAPKMDPALGLPEPAAEQPLQFGSLDPGLMAGMAPAPLPSPASAAPADPMGMLSGILR